MLVCAVVMTRWDSDNSTIKTPSSPPNGAEDSDIRLSDRRPVCCHVDCLRPACNISSEGNVQGLDGALLPKGAAIKTRTGCWRLFFVISSRGLETPAATHGSQAQEKYLPNCIGWLFGPEPNPPLRVYM